MLRSQAAEGHASLKEKATNVLVLLVVVVATGWGGSYISIHGD